jgi:hypothetical protein
VVGDDDDDDDAETTGGTTGGTTGAPIDCTAIADGVAQGRIVGGAIEVLMDGATPDTLACGDGLPYCSYELHKLVPNNGGIAPGTFVDGMSSTHEVDYCWCCNGEGGDPPEEYGTLSEAGGQLVIEAVTPECVVGSFEAEGMQQPFVALWCA